MNLPVDVGPESHSLGWNLLHQTEKHFTHVTPKQPVTCSKKTRTYLGRPLLLTVIEERTKQAAVEMVQHCDQEELVELKGCWELQSESEK